MTLQSTSRSRRLGFRVVQGATVVLIALLALHMARGVDAAHPATWNETAGDAASLGSFAKGTPAYRGVLTFATTGNGDPFHPAMVQDLDLTSGNLSVRFNGLDASRGHNGETAYLQRLAPGVYAPHAVVVADTRGVPGQPLFICDKFNSSSNRVCGAPKVSPDGDLVAFASVGSGTYCDGGYGMKWGTFVNVVDRRGKLVARFEGYNESDWLPDGRLLVLGSACRMGGIYVTDRAMQSLSRIDDGQVSMPAGAPAVRPDGKVLAFVWNNQLWSMSLTGKPELTQLTNLAKSVSAGAWSPDGSALAVIMFDVSMPVRSLVLFKPGDEKSVVVRQLGVYPYGPVSWR